MSITLLVENNKIRNLESFFAVVATFYGSGGLINLPLVHGLLKNIDNRRKLTPRLGAEHYFLLFGTLEKWPFPTRQRKF